MYGAVPSGTRLETAGHADRQATAQRQESKRNASYLSAPMKSPGATWQGGSYSGRLNMASF